MPDKCYIYPELDGKICPCKKTLISANEINLSRQKKDIKSYDPTTQNIMQIPLSHFEKYIDETILARGLAYFKKGYVISFEEISSGEFEAVVEGTEEYIVRLKVRSNTVTENSCTCPYDFGPVCKHVATVLFYMQQEELGLKQPVNKKEVKTKPDTKRKTVSEQVDEMLTSLSHDDLKKFIKEQSLSDPVFRRLFFTGFAHKASDESPAVYRQQVKNILKSAMGRDRFIDWSRAGMVGKAVFGLLGMAMKHVVSCAA
jgi:uncharacterized Zn finger protein